MREKRDLKFRGTTYRRVLAATVGILVLVIATAAISSTGGSDSPERQNADSGPYEITSLRFPAGPGSGEPFLTARDGVTYASWLEAGENGVTRFLFSRLDARKTIWSEPVQIAEGDNWFVNWADVPSIAIGPDNRMAAHWLERSGLDRYAYGIRFSLSADAGKTWTEAEWLHEDQSATEHGFASLSFSPDGSLDAVWLDGRAMALGEQRMSMMSRHISADGQMGAEVVVDEQTCECCPTALVRSESGSLLSAYRDRSEGELREIAVKRWDGGSWTDPVYVTNDGWHISACPVNGPAIASSGSSVALAWFSAPGDVPVVNASFSGTDGHSFGDVVQVNEGRAIGRIGLNMLDAERAVVSWIESSGPESGEAGIKMRIIHRDGTLEKTVVVAATSSSRSSGYPRVSAHGDSILFAWTEVGEEKRVVSAIARRIE
jgi:hypothetical protein